MYSISVEMATFVTSTFLATHMGRVVKGDAINLLNHLLYLLTVGLLDRVIEILESPEVWEALQIELKQNQHNSLNDVFRYILQTLVYEDWLDSDAYDGTSLSPSKTKYLFKVCCDINVLDIIQTSIPRLTATKFFNDRPETILVKKESLRRNIGPIVNSFCMSIVEATSYKRGSCTTEADLIGVIKTIPGLEYFFTYTIPLPKHFPVKCESFESFRVPHLDDIKLEHFNDYVYRKICTLNRSQCIELLENQYIGKCNATSYYRARSVYNEWYKNMCLSRLHRLINMFITFK